MIAIVGGGASGILAAIQIGLQATVPCRVTLYDPAEYPSGGLAYGTRNLSHLLNVPAGRISALPDRPDHFLRWLRSPGNVAGLLRDERVRETDFVPRAVYGCYLFALLEDVYARPACQARLDLRASRVIDFIPARNGGTVVSAEGDTEDVSHVVLALGNLPPRDPLPGRHPFFSSSRYVPRVWEKGVIRVESPKDDVLLVGSGLTSVDVILGLEEGGHRGKYFVTSRGGRWPMRHGEAGPYRGIPAELLPTGDLRELVRFIRGEIRSVGAENWRGVIDALRPHTQTLWKRLSLDDRRRFLRHVRPFWESHRHRMPQTAWATLERLRAEGRLELFPGRLRDFKEDDAGVTACIQAKGLGSVRSLRVAKVFNCIGPESNFRQHFNEPLLINLLARGVLHPDPLFLGIEATDTLEPVGATGHVFEQISLIGPPLKSMFWESTAIPEIRQQAALVATRALRHHHLQPSWEI